MLTDNVGVIFSKNSIGLHRLLPSYWSAACAALVGKEVESSPLCFCAVVPWGWLPQVSSLLCSSRPNSHSVMSPVSWTPTTVGNLHWGNLAMLQIRELVLRHCFSILNVQLLAFISTPLCNQYPEYSTYTNIFT